MFPEDAWGTAFAQVGPDEIILQALQNERDEGFNFYLSDPAGLFINWITVPAPPP